MPFLVDNARYRPDQESRRPPPLTHTDLPVLNFKGVNEHLEDLVARINAPLLDKLSTVFFHQLILDTPLLTQFISRIPKLKMPDGAQLLVVIWMRKLGSHFHGYPTEVMERSNWEFLADNHLGSFHLWRRSLACPLLTLLSPRWDTSTSSRKASPDGGGKVTSRADNSCNFFIHLP